MSFERFTESGRGHKPKLSIRGVGQIGLNIGAIIKFKLKDYSHVVLFYDKDNKRIGVQLTTDESELGACKLHVRHQSAAIPARSFLDYYDIEYVGKTRKFDVTFIEETKMIIADIGDDMKEE